MPLGLAYALVRDNVLASLAPASRAWTLVPSALVAAALTLTVGLAAFPPEVMAVQHVSLVCGGALALFGASFWSLRIGSSRLLFARVPAFQPGMRRMLDALSRLRTPDGVVQALVDGAATWLEPRAVSFVPPEAVAGIAHLDDGARRALAGGDTPDLRASLFLPGVSSKPTGMGLGLVIARKLAASEGWTLALADTEQTTFTLCLGQVS